MKLKMILILVLCSFVACLPTALGISCYSCVDYPGSNQPCSNPSVIQCESYYDSCMTLSVTAQMMGSQVSTTLKNCSMSAFTCNQTLMCGQTSSSISDVGGTVLSCSVGCCSGDLCNGQAQAKKRENKQRVRGTLLMKKTLATLKESFDNILTKKRRM